MTPPIGISYSSSSTTSASAAPIFVASGTTYDMLVHTQDFVFQYKLVTYGQSTSGLWPPEGLCTTVSAYQCTMGYSNAEDTRVSFTTTGLPWSEHKQTYQVSAYNANYYGHGLQSSGIIFASGGDGEKITPWSDLTDSVGASSIQYNTGQYHNRSTLVIPIHNTQVIDGDDGGAAARAFMMFLLHCVRWGDYQWHMDSNGGNMQGNLKWDTYLVN